MINKVVLVLNLYKDGLPTNVDLRKRPIPPVRGPECVGFLTFRRIKPYFRHSLKPSQMQLSSRKLSDTPRWNSVRSKRSVFWGPDVI
jgi:hypothetical protein